MGRQPRIVVVGGGVSGLVAAYDLTRRGAHVTVLEADDRLGGKIATVEVAGVSADTGAESILARRPEAIALFEELGLNDHVRHPGDASPRILSRGRLRRLPRPQVMGVPASWPDLARSRVLSPPGLLRAAADVLLPSTPLHGDVSVGRYVGRRMGQEVVDRLVEPLLAGVYAGRADHLSFNATIPALAGEVSSARTLTGATARVARRARRAASDEPVFAGLRGGLGKLVDALTEQGAARIETGWIVREVARTSTGWQVTAHQRGAGNSTTVQADGVVLACPAAPAARLLRAHVPTAATALRDIRTASTAVISLAFPKRAFPTPPQMSGVLVPVTERRAIKAITFSSVKWPWLDDELRAAHPREELILLRCSVGRVDQESELQADDVELRDRAERELSAIFGVRGGSVDARVTRWGGALPQYDVGHQQRVERVRGALTDYPGIEVCGAALDGVGIAACVATARDAAERLAAQVGLHLTTNAETTGETQ